MVLIIFWVVNKLYLFVWVNKFLFFFIIGKNINICEFFYILVLVYMYVVYDLFMGI